MYLTDNPARYNHTIPYGLSKVKMREKLGQQHWMLWKLAVSIIA